jgi:hypothetical protein
VRWAGIALTTALALQWAGGLAPVGASEPGLGELVDIGSSQPMLVERISKAYVLIGLGNRTRSARAQLYNAVERFEAQVEQLAAQVAMHPRLAGAVDRVRERWRAFDALVEGPVRRDQAARLLDLEVALTEACQGVVAALVDDDGHGRTGLVASAGRQRMLAQRLAKTYALLAWGIDDARVYAQFVSAWNEFEEALDVLEHTGDHTARLALSIDSAREQWRWMKGAMSLHREGSYFPDIVDDAGEKIVDIFDQITATYASLTDEAGS